MKQKIRAQIPILGRSLVWKRIFDVLFSLAVLVGLSPLLLTICITIVFFSRASPLYAQQRIGRNGRPFKCYKFRTMVPDAETALEELLIDPRFKKEWEENHKLKNDPRITPIGRFLRRTSLDELPQFYNVIIGDLSVVGPRAVVLEEINTHFKEQANEIFRVRPGITGLWQVSGRSDVGYSKRIELDRRYVKDMSLKLDMKIVAKTIPIIFNAKGAY
jgi:undecaprenyl-phosphate galactose phosphotransferase